MGVEEQSRYSKTGGNVSEVTWVLLHVKEIKVAGSAGKVEIGELLHDKERKVAGSAGKFATPVCCIVKLSRLGGKTGRLTSTALLPI